MKYEWDDSVTVAISNSILSDGRKIIADIWAEGGYTFVTYKFTSKGIENFNKTEVLEYLRSKGLDLYGNNYELDSFLKDGKEEYYTLTTVIGKPEY